MIGLEKQNVLFNLCFNNHTSSSCISYVMALRSMGKVQGLCLGRQWVSADCWAYWWCVGVGMCEAG